MSNEQNKKDVQLAEPQEAIFKYLDQLLREIPDEPEQIAVEVTPEVVKIDVPVEPPTIIETQPETVVTQEVEVETPVTTQQRTEPQTEALEQPYPEFASQSFQCLVFELAGLNMAIPLDKLNGILEWNEEIVTPMPGHSPWFMGLLPERGMQIKVIEAAKLVVPAKYREAYSGPPIQKVILINDSEWGLACNEVKEVITLEHDQVKWRQAAGKRPWLLGTVIDEMCALLDADEFAAMLASEKAQVI